MIFFAVEVGRRKEIDIMITSLKSEVLNDALHKIQDYCEKEIIPKMEYSNRLEINFGEVLYRGWESKYEYSFAIDKSKMNIYYRSGGLMLCFKKEAYTSSTIYDLCSWVLTKDLILYWQDVKHKLLEELDRQEQEFKAVSNFQV